MPVPVLLVGNFPSDKEREETRVAAPAVLRLLRSDPQRRQALACLSALTCIVADSSRETLPFWDELTAMGRNVLVERLIPRENSFDPTSVTIEDDTGRFI